MWIYIFDTQLHTIKQFIVNHTLKSYKSINISDKVVFEL